MRWSVLIEKDFLNKQNLLKSRSIKKQRLKKSCLVQSMFNEKKLANCFQIWHQKKENFLFLLSSLSLATSKCLFVCMGIDKQKNISWLMNKLIINLASCAIDIAFKRKHTIERKKSCD